MIAITAITNKMWMMLPAWKANMPNNQPIIKITAIIYNMLPITKYLVNTSIIKTLPNKIL
jgi:hypothetical protein